jgi:ABC-type transport system involved in multi-copper enzyme maturation permease subunit
MFEIYKSTVAARGLRPLPLALGAGLVVLMGVIAYVDEPRDLPAPILSMFYTVIVSAGLVGLDVLNGSVHVLLTRPITRSGYLAGRFLGALTISATVCASMYAMAALAATARGESDVTGGILAGQAVSALAAVVWVSSLMLFGSTFLPERGDVLAFIAVAVLGLALPAAATLSGQTSVIHAAHAASANLLNRLPAPGDWTSSAFASDALRWSSNVSCVLAGAAIVFNRRELSYAAD